MKACIISIGNELLSGQTVDTNAAWLSGQLFQRGIATAGSWAVPDEQSRIVAAIGQAATEGTLILITGGLGPTDDDITRQAVAAWLEVDLEFHPDIRISFGDVRRDSQKALNVHIAFYLRFQLLDVNTSYCCMGDDA
jgi:molybdenum cofactor synthesis domain-containing protein